MCFACIDGEDVRVARATSSASDRTGAQAEVASGAGPVDNSPVGSDHPDASGETQDTTVGR